MTEPKPDFWYLIPHGYVPLDLNPPLEQIESLVRQVLSLPDEQRDRAERVLRFYTGIITSMNAQDVRVCLFGMHPDDQGDPTFSVVTFSTVQASGGHAKLVIAGMAGTAADSPEEGLRPLELPAGLGLLTEEMRSMPAPGPPPEGSDDPPVETVWQGTVALTCPGNSDILVLQMVTPAVDLADHYRDILIGVAHTVSFTDPSLPETAGDATDGDPEPGSVAAMVRSDFG
ncbi:hypothetical protein [Streptomyces flavidovirens]|uniref:hypothetical protein n=1 Tax=Streptomyces flavidovirens TaxID=67298 RepID=UPI0003FFAE0A|nr:hypothetical protein [Streptomyces flavidovirens]